jgi:hypothetical protein
MPMRYLSRVLTRATSIALCAMVCGTAARAASYGFNSHMLPDRAVADPYATKPGCLRKSDLITARRYLGALRTDVASVEAWRSRTGDYPAGAFPVQRVGALQPEYVRTRSGFGFVLKFKPFSAIRPLFNCGYLSVASPTQLNQRGLPWQSPDGSPGAVFAFTPETGLYLVGDFKQ